MSTPEVWLVYQQQRMKRPARMRSSAVYRWHPKGHCPYHPDKPAHWETQIGYVSADCLRTIAAYDAARLAKIDAAICELEEQKREAIKIAYIRGTPLETSFKRESI